MLTPVLQVRFFAIQSSRRVHRDYTLLAQPSASAPPLRSRIVSPEPTALRRTNDENQRIAMKIRVLARVALLTALGAAHGAATTDGLGPRDSAGLADVRGQRTADDAASTPPGAVPLLLTGVALVGFARRWSGAERADDV